MPKKRSFILPGSLMVMELQEKKHQMQLRRIFINILTKMRAKLPNYIVKRIRISLSLRLFKK
jgi:hypothetical protein